ncbi:MAG: hypothetical protein WBM83_07245 [Flavobacteriaceae bacterium]
MKTKVSYIVILGLLLLGCKPKSEKLEAKDEPSVTDSVGISFTSSNKKLEEAFTWAKHKALSYAHDGTDPVGLWYEAALPNREAFCMRDVSHQAIGAELLGLGEHNFNMFLKFAQNISEELDYCSYWEINRYNLPAPVDYEDSNDFWYNLPANFDVTFNAYRIYNWTGNKAYLENKDLQNFYNLSMNEYVDHWDLGHSEVLTRNRKLHEKKGEDMRFNGKRGIPTYNEGGRGETILGIDMTASLVAGYRAYAAILKRNGDMEQSSSYKAKAEEEQQFLNDFWWDPEQNSFRSIWYEDGTFDYFMVGNNQAFLHYLLYFDALQNPDRIGTVADGYVKNFDKLIVELKSYLPIIFYENGQTALANQMVIDLSAPENQRRDYPENSFTIIEHLTSGLMGINADAESYSFSTIPRLQSEIERGQMINIPILSNKISITHEGNAKTLATNQKGPSIQWTAQFSGHHEYLYVNNYKVRCLQTEQNGSVISYYSVMLDEREQSIIAINPS